ncbi:MAG: HAD-IC family P-type ATPase, partial [Candidatus Micrarchaeota archaeon]|nr:HAD-IC family P-type ATPase [Candidatus Micrarchaeota archaeon]
MDWDGNRAHSLSLASLYQSLDTSDSGLSQQEVARRLEKYGKNSPSDVKRKPWYDLLFAQFTNLPIIMLICAALVSLALGLFVDREKLLDAAAITVALLLACLFGFFQEYKAENAIAALKKMAISRSVVVRSGKDYEIDSSEIVLGDIVELEEGNRVPADIRLIESANLAVDASMLTGESKPSKKEAGTLPAKTQMPDRSNMIFAGTLVVRGRCKGVVVATGGLTEFGKIARFVAETAESETPLQKSIHELSKTLGIVGLAFATLFFVFGTAMGETAVNMLVVAITLAVAVIPEGLPTVLAITMALGVQKMARKNAIVRKMAAVEALGSATVICTDKTGTLTQNKMAVHRIMLP